MAYEDWLRVIVGCIAATALHKVFERCISSPPERQVSSSTISSEDTSTKNRKISAQLHEILTSTTKMQLSLDALERSQHELQKSLRDFRRSSRENLREKTATILLAMDHSLGNVDQAILAGEYRLATAMDALLREAEKEPREKGEHS